MSAGALLLARFSGPEGLVPAAEVLEHSEIVECWNAVDGHIDLVAKLNAPPSELLERLRNLSGIQEAVSLDLSDETGALVCDPGSAHSFVFLDVERLKNAIIHAKLQALDAVAFCSSMHDGTELVAVISGTNFHAIDRTINEQIRTIDGVLRLKQDRVINLRQL
jgi:hypothetical protein